MYILEHNGEKIRIILKGKEYNLSQLIIIL